MRKDDRIRLTHMLDSAREAVHFAGGKTRDDLEADRLLALGLMKCIEIIGEAAANISNECRETLPTIPWRSILGMRNRLVHAYFEIDLDVVWYTTNVSLPPLIQILEEILTPKPSG
ncbi:MAG: DUF86 domain-containing protein [Desulfomonile tiedjei]|uniref:DUF86 domain-containing protein n=1 Tax=Desulfomonile tiedjei TaxID=2358 RepID=A0A9D6UXR3_9BACT|nr:DUF86 domain-containing protein [Desulfomonile tiedjei]